MTLVGSVESFIRRSTPDSATQIRNHRPVLAEKEALYLEIAAAQREVDGGLLRFGAEQRRRGRQVGAVYEPGSAEHDELMFLKTKASDADLAQTNLDGWRGGFRNV